MGLKLKLVTKPSEEPITLDETKDHLRLELDDASEDALVARLIVAARRRAENFLWRAIMKQTWDYFLDDFPGSADTILLPLPPLQSVTTVKYIDLDGVQQTLAASLWKVDAVSEPARLVPAFEETWPSTREEINAVEIRFVAGYTNIGEVPEEVKSGMKMMTASWYENRESLREGGELQPIPLDEAAMADYRVYRFA